MERRKFVLGLGSLAAGGAAAMGTGAFSVKAKNREFTANVAGDKAAYLGLDARESPYARQTSDGKLAVSLQGNGRGEGLNQDAITTIDKLFVVKNQGTEAVDVTVSLDDYSGHVTPYARGDTDFDLSANSVSLSPGQAFWVGATIDLTGITGTPQFENGTFTVEAE